MKYFKFIAMLLVLLLLVGCAPDESDRIFEELMQQGQGEYDLQDSGVGGAGVDEPDAPEDGAATEQVPDEPPFFSDLSGELHILTSEWDMTMRVFARHFTRLHPDVTITFEDVAADSWNDMAQLMALMTRLLADPPDIFNTVDRIFEKVAMDALFVDLNEFIDGPNGVNRADYFDNVFRGAEVQGGLFHMPLIIATDTILLNKDLFEAIGVPIDDMRTITLDEFLDFHQRAYEKHPDDEIHFHFMFDEMHVFRFERVYDLETGVVSVDTPEMAERLERINAMPINRQSPVIRGPAVDPSFFRATGPRIEYMYHHVSDLWAPWIFFLQDHPNMLFSPPVHMVAGTGEIRFQSWFSPAIMRNSPNQELAWEFIRFCMEFSENLWHEDPQVNEWDFWHLFPVNRAMFENFLRPYLNFRHWVTVQTDVITLTGDEDIDTRDREARIEYSIYRFAELIEMLNFEVRHNFAVLDSLIYPDINLFVTGQQSVERALANIQNRLELYVAE